LEYSCLEGEGDREHYTEDAGGLKPNVANPATAAARAISSPSAAEYAIVGCLRADLNNSDVRYALGLFKKKDNASSRHYVPIAHQGAFQPSNTKITLGGAHR